MSRRQRAVVSLGVAAIIVGLATGAAVDPGITDDAASNAWPTVPSTKEEVTPETAGADPAFVQTTELTWPVVNKTVYNTCRNEGPIVLNGIQKTRTRLEVDPLNGTELRLQQWKDTRGIYGTYTYYEDYWDDVAQLWKQRERVVKYHNRQRLLDKFHAGPVRAPFRTGFESVMLLEREGQDPAYKRRRPGGNLFVFVRSMQKIDKNGNISVEETFWAECK